MSRVPARLRPALRLLLVGGIVAVLLARVGTDAVLGALGSITAPVLLAALALGALTTVAAAARWCVVARGVGLTLTVGRATADVYRATFLNSVLPAGVLGDVHRAVSRRGEGDGRGARAVVLERVAGQLVVVVAGIAVLVASPGLLAAALGGLVPGGVLLGAIALLLLGVVGVAMVARGPRATRLRELAVATGADVRAGLLSARTGPGVVVLSVLAFGGYVALFVVAARTAGVQAPLVQLLPLLVLGLLAMAVPLTVGGWGPREAVSTLAFGTVGLGAEQGLSVAVVYGVLSLVSCLPGAVVLFLAASPTRSPGSSLAGRAPSAPAGVLAASPTRSPGSPLADRIPSPRSGVTGAPERPNAAPMGDPEPVPWRACSSSCATARRRPMLAG